MKRLLAFLIFFSAFCIWWTSGEALKWTPPRGNNAANDTTQIDTGDHLEVSHAHFDSIAGDSAVVGDLTVTGVATFSSGTSSNFSYINADTINVDTLTVNVNGKVGFLSGVHVVFDDGSSANISLAVLDTLIIGVYDPTEALRPVSATTDWGFMTYVVGSSAYDTLMISPGQNSAGLFNSILMGTVNTTNNDADGTWGHVFEIVGKDINLGFRGRVGPAGGFNGKLNVGYDDIDFGRSHEQGIGGAGSGYTRIRTHGLSSDQALLQLQSEYTGDIYNSFDMFEQGGGTGGGVGIFVLDEGLAALHPVYFATGTSKTIINDVTHSAGYSSWGGGTTYDQTFEALGDSSLTVLGGLDVKGGALFTGDILSVYGDATSAPGLQIDAGAAHADSVILSATTIGACVGCSEPPLAIKTGGQTIMTFTGAGLLGIGTTLPSDVVDIGHVTQPTIIFKRIDDTITNGNLLGRFDFSGTDGYSEIAPGISARISAYARESWATGSRGGALTFSTVDNGTAVLDERLRIDESGNIGIGTTLADKKVEINTGSSANGIRFSYNDGNGSATTYNDLSVGSSGILSVTSSGTTAANFLDAVNIDVDGTATVSDADLTVQNGATWSKYNAGDADWATSSDSTLKENLHTAGNSKIQHLWDIFASKDSIDVWAYNWKKSSLESPETIAHIWEDTTKIEERVQKVLAQDSTSVESAVRDSITTLVWAGIDAKLIADSLRVEQAHNKKHVGLIAQQATRIERLLSGEDDPTQINHERIQAASLLMIMEMARRIDDLQAQVDSLKTLHTQ